MVVIILIILLIILLIYNFNSNIYHNELYQNIQSNKCNAELINIQSASERASRPVNN